MDTTNERKLESVTITLTNGDDETVECTAAEVFGAFMYFFDDGGTAPIRLMTADIIVEVEYNYAVQEAASVHPLQ